VTKVVKMCKKLRVCEKVTFFQTLNKFCSIFFLKFFRINFCCKLDDIVFACDSV